MPRKDVSTARANFVSGAISQIIRCLYFALACSLAHAADVNYSGTLKSISLDSGGAVYSGVATGTGFAGVINDVTQHGYISDGTTRTSLSCCSGDGAEGLRVLNDLPLEAGDPAILNPLLGTSFSEGDMIDVIVLDGEAPTENGGQIVIEVAWLFDRLEFDNENLDNYYPPDQSHVLGTLFFIEERGQVNDIYSAVGTIDELTITPHEFRMNAGLNDAWFNPDTDGQGFFITVFPDLGFVSLAWFTYDTALPPEDATANLGDPGHRWLTALGPIEGDKADMTISISSGGLFDTATEIERVDDGTLTLTFADCSSGTVDYNIPSISQQGTVPIQRVAADNTDLCETLDLQ